MACGCGCSNECNCRVIAGSGAIVTGTGQQFDPYVISLNSNVFEPVDTECVDMNMEGFGTPGDPYKISAELNIDPSNTNLLVCSGTGLSVSCEAVMGCVSDNIGCGLEVMDGTLCVMISPDANNQIECRDNGLFAAFDCDDIGCGLRFNGDGEIEVFAGDGLECDEATGRLNVNADCGLVINAAGGLEVDTPHVSAQTTVEPAPQLTVVPGPPGNATEDDINVGTILGRACIRLVNPNCYVTRGTFNFEFYAEYQIAPGTDITFVADTSDDGGATWRFFGGLDRTFLHPAANGGNVNNRNIYTLAVSKFGEFNLPVGANRVQCVRIRALPTPLPNGGQGYEFGRVLNYRYTIVADSTINQ